MKGEAIEVIKVTVTTEVKIEHPPPKHKKHVPCLVFTIHPPKERNK